jgi:hypothetical protein
MGTRIARHGTNQLYIAVYLKQLWGITFVKRTGFMTKQEDTFDRWN